MEEISMARADGFGDGQELGDAVEPRCHDLEWAYGAESFGVAFKAEEDILVTGIDPHQVEDQVFDVGPNPIIPDLPAINSDPHANSLSQTRLPAKCDRK